MLAATANTLPPSAETDSLWIHVVPKGELPNTEAGIVQVLDDVSLKTILAEIEGDKQRLGNKWPGLYAGREHFIYDEDADSAALAWFKEFDLRDDGIWANGAGLTPIGRQSIANGEYKFTSFVADRAHTQNIGGNKVRILKLDTVGFTNQANGKELLSPITNRGGRFIFNTTAAISTSSLSPQQAAQRFSVIVNRVKAESGCTFDEAWNLTRGKESALFNRMAAQPEKPRPTRTATADPLCQYAANALSTLVERERRALSCTFAEAWPRVCNRRRDLFRLSNRELSPDAWAVLEGQAFDKFTSKFNLGPDGKLLQLEDAERAFQVAYDAISGKSPDLKPREVWEQIKTQWPQVYWPFVAVTAQ